MASMSSVASGAMTGAKLGSFIPGVGSLVGGLAGGIAGLFGRRKKPQQPSVPNIDPLDAAWGDALQGRTPGTDTLSQWRERSLNFDPQEAMNRSAMGTWDAMRPSVDMAIGDLRQTQSAMGRARSGFATEDEDRIMTDALRDLNARVASNAVSGAGMELSNIGQIGDIGRDQRDTHLDLVTGGLDRRTDERNALDARRAGRSNATMGAIGQIGGTLAGKVPWGKVGGWLKDIF